MSDYDVLSLCIDRGDHYEVDPAVMFPATVARIKAVIAGEPPTEIVSVGWTGRPDREPVADRFLREAERFNQNAWELALEPYDEDAPEKLIEIRSATLAFAESWFKRALALKAGHGIRVHFIKNPDYKRS